MIPVTGKISIDPVRLKISFLRAPGPGGQNVNKVATAVKLRFDLAGSVNLSEEVKQRLAHLAGKRINRKGQIVIQASRYRTQKRNREDAMDRLVVLIRRAAQQPKRRKRTRPTAASRRRRLVEKKRRSQTKTFRRPVQGQ